MEHAPEFRADERAQLTDEFYQRMIANPDDSVPFLVNWTLVRRELADA